MEHNSGGKLTMKKLTSAQRDELIEQFVEIQLYNMDKQDLYELASEYATNSFDRLTDSEIKERIESLWDSELYDELVDNVTSDNKPAESNKNLSEIAPVSSYATPENKVIRYQEMTHDSEGC